MIRHVTFGYLIPWWALVTVSFYLFARLLRCDVTLYVLGYVCQPFNKRIMYVCTPACHRRCWLERHSQLCQGQPLCHSALRCCLDKTQTSQFTLVFTSRCAVSKLIVICFFLYVHCEQQHTDWHRRGRFHSHKRCPITAWLGLLLTCLLWKATSRGCRCNTNE